jgi:hypothetical protein
MLFRFLIRGSIFIPKREESNRLVERSSQQTPPIVRDNTGLLGVYLRGCCKENLLNDISSPVFFVKIDVVHKLLNLLREPFSSDRQRHLLANTEQGYEVRRDVHGDTGLFEEMQDGRG